MDFVYKRVFEGEVNSLIKTDAFDVRKFKEAIFEVKYSGANIEGEIIVEFTTNLRKGQDLSEIDEDDWRLFEGMPILFDQPDFYFHEYLNGNFGAIRFTLKSINGNPIDFLINFNSKPLHTL